MQEGRLPDLLQQLGPTQMQSTHSALAGALSFFFALRWIRIRMSRCGSQSMRWLWDLISLFPTVVYLSVLALPRSFVRLL